MAKNRTNSPGGRRVPIGVRVKVPAGPLMVKGVMPSRPQAIPADLAGSWIAWSPDGLRIVGHGATIDEARRSAGHIKGVRFAKVPRLATLRPACGRPETAL